MTAGADPSQPPGTPSAAARAAGLRPTASAVERLGISPGEIAAVCARYDLGKVTSAKRLELGSDQSHKVILHAERGVFLLKRRSPQHAHPHRVAVSHEVHLHLARAGFPTARLIGTAGDNNSMVQIREQVYELFEFVRGGAYPRDEASTHEAGAVLGDFHRLLEDFRPSWALPSGTWHDSPATRAALRRLDADAGAAGAHSGREREIVRLLTERYARCARLALESLAASRQPPERPIHADWHPGNMIFDGPRLAAVLDFDSVRLGPRAIDVASGALHFSIQSGGDSPAQWPNDADYPRFRAFLAGYHARCATPLDGGEIRAIPHLMIEAMIGEAASRLAATGRFGRFTKDVFLAMIERKSRSMFEGAERLTRMAEDTAAGS